MPVDAVRKFLHGRYRVEEYPALNRQFLDWQRTRPLAGKKILDGTPVFANTLLKYINLLVGGADLTVGYCDSIPYDKTVVDFLQSIGVKCVYNCSAAGAFDVILDCNAVYCNLLPRYGFAELTRSGAYHFAKVDAAVVNVDDSRIKAIETCLGTGEGFLRAMRQLNLELKGRKVVVMGCGKVGRGVVFYAFRAGAEVVAFDDPAVVQKCVGGKLLSCFDRDRVCAELQRADVVVSATGKALALADDSYIKLLLEGSQIVVNMGVEDEWGPALPPQRVLNGKAPLNFILDEPTLLRYIDPTMALHNHAALELLLDSGSGIRRVSDNVHDFYWQEVVNNGVIASELAAAEL
ncbi:MAG: hypothetical protein E7056_05045 [Lentisphaerae bacterium]|nr:hypothetical protein [Lentisphaerota bacterium]